MIITLKTPYSAAHSLFKIILVGPAIFLIIALLPALLFFILGNIFHFNPYYYENGIIQLIVAAWNFLLSYVVKINIGIYYIPCWLFSGIIGILLIFNIIAI